MTTQTQMKKAIFDKKTLSIGFLLFLFIVFLRPIVLILPNVHIFSISTFELFGIFSSYLLLLIIFFNFRNILWNRTCFFVLVFISYSFLSILWGSDIKEVSRIVLPFLMIFLISFLITEKNEVIFFYQIIYLSFILPIFYSTYLILSHKGDSAVDYYSGIERFSGAFQGTHVQAYTMLFFIFFLTLHILQKNNIKNFFNIHVLVTFALSVFCLYKSTTRTVYVGLFIFIIFLTLGFGLKHKFKSFCLLIVLLITVSFSGHIQKIIWKTEDRDLTVASSGRTEIWDHNLNVFKKMSLPQKIVGIGLGCEGKFINEFNTRIIESHNDYLSLIMSLGILGLTIYVLLLISILYDISNSKISQKIKFTFLGILISVMVMNFLSNAVIFRLEFSQYFWIIVGLFYKLNHFSNTYSSSQMN